MPREQTDNHNLQEAFALTSRPAKRTRADFICWTFCALTFAYLVSGIFFPVKRIGLPISPLAPISSQPSEMSGTGFARGAVYPATLQPQLSARLPFFGSWIGSDNSVGSMRSAWYPAKSEFNIFVAGYPTRPGLQMSLEVRTGSNDIVSVPVSLEKDPGLQWQSVTLSLKAVKAPKEFRIVATDQSKAWGGWLGVSAPFVPAAPLSVGFFHQLTLVLMATAAAILFFLSPGLVLRQLVLGSRGRLLEFIWIPIPGLLGLSLLGLFVWIGPRFLSARLISRVGLALLFFFVVYRLAQVPLATYTSTLERGAILVLIVLVAVAVGKSTYSLGPVGELYRGTISRTLEVGDRSDSRISYCTAEMVALRSRPYSAFAGLMLGPWNFSDRGPLAALAVTPLILAGPSKIPGTVPDQTWMLFDPEGFAAYRIAMIAMACCGLLITFGISKWILPEPWALLAYLVTVTAPFAIHEIYFTWPKIVAASFVLLAAYLILRSRYFLAGFFLGIGYLFHPSTLLSVPTLLGLIILRPIAPHITARLSVEKVRQWAMHFAALFSGLAIWLLAWRLINRHHFAQSGFVFFYLQADRQVATLGNWLQDRLNSLLNTLLPLNLFLFHRKEYFVNAIEAPSPPIVEFFFQPWTGVPFGGGVLFFFCLLRLAYTAFTKARAWFMLLIVVPFLVFTAYWGAASSGVLREGMHAWFLSLMIGSVIILYRFAASHQTFFRFLNFAVLFRGVEILLMLLLPTIWTQQKVIQQRYWISDTLSLLVMFAGTIWLVWFTFTHAEKMRNASSSSTGELLPNVCRATSA